MQIQEQVEVMFVEDDIICPFCESYEVIEEELEFHCSACSQAWKTLSMDR